MSDAEAGGRQVRKRLALAAGIAALAFGLSACGDNAADTASAGGVTPAAAADPPASPRFIPGVPTGPLNLSVADLVGRWAMAAADCADPAQILNISSTAVIRPGGARSTINATSVSDGRLILQLAQTVNGIRRSEVWTFASTTPALPVLGLDIATAGSESVTWVRCTAGVI